MNVGDLLALIEDLDPETEIRIAHQPTWPLEYALAAAEVVYPPGHPDALHGNGPDPLGGGEPEPTWDGETPVVVYLVEGSQVGYLPGHVAEAVGWA